MATYIMHTNEDLKSIATHVPERQTTRDLSTTMVARLGYNWMQ